MKKNKQPLVSVILPVYNAENYLTEAIASILNQTYQRFELIIVDDASTDSSWKIITSFQKKNSKKIKSFRLRKNRNKGGDEAGNFAFQKSSGAYIARMDADDVAHPKRLKKQVEYLESHFNCDVLGSDAHVINQSGEVTGEKNTLTDHKSIYQNYFTFHPMIHPTVMIRKSALKNKKRLYHIDLPSNNDYYTLFEMITDGHKFANLPEKLLFYRMHGQNDSLKNIKKTFKNTLKTRFKLVRNGKYQPSTIAWIKCLAQMIIIYLLPERAIFNLYIIMRGISTPHLSLPQKLIASTS